MVAGPARYIDSGSGAETLRLVGEYDVLRAPQLREELLGLVETGRPVLIDLREATFVDSACLAVFVAGFKQARGRQPLAILVPQERNSHVNRTFEISGLNRVLPLVRSIEEAQVRLNDPSSA